MKVRVPVAPYGAVAPRLGQAPRVAVADVGDAVITAWQEFDVRWDTAHDEGTEGAHHARIARFLIEHQVDVVVAHRVGDGMRRMLASMHIRLGVDASGDARDAVRSAVAPPVDPGSASPAFAGDQ